MASSAVPAEGRERIVPIRWYHSRFAVMVPYPAGFLNSQISAYALRRRTQACRITIHIGQVKKKDEG